MKVSELCGLLKEAMDTAEEIRQILEGKDQNKAVGVSTMELTAYRNLIQAMAEFIDGMEIG